MSYRKSEHLARISFTNALFKKFPYSEQIDAHSVKTRTSLTMGSPSVQLALPPQLTGIECRDDREAQANAAACRLAAKRLHRDTDRRPVGALGLAILTFLGGVLTQTEWIMGVGEDVSKYVFILAVASALIVLLLLARAIPIRREADALEEMATLWEQAPECCREMPEESAK